ncbi:hypothetical protein [Streptomyces nanshensis]|uniref:Uncharacterized protein n=1 Tax=Streptomyces nanshensis TaxID=518642 RepID=A0A1E7L206_9ACTN|nr:hypothetical protein [Streptomyces nanshensis]OEV10225.1 hypothetical protein AN218_18575 [Streptomyces nanshensis]
MTISTEHRPPDAADAPAQDTAGTGRRVHVRLRRGKPAGVFRTVVDAKRAAERAASVRAGLWREAPAHGEREHELVETDVHGPWPDESRVYVLVDHGGRYRSVHGTTTTDQHRAVTDRFICLRIQEPAYAAA